MSKQVLIILFSGLVGLAMNIAHPATPAYLRTLTISADMFGIIFASMNLGNFLMAPVWGNLGDIKNRKYIIAFTLFFYGVSQFFFGYFSNIYLIILVRFAAGFFAAGVISNGLAHISEDPYYETIRKRTISSFVSFFAIGGAAGYYLGGWVGTYFVGQESYVLFTQAMVTMLVVVFFLIFVDVPNFNHQNKARPSFINQIKQFKTFSKPLMLLILIAVIISIAHTNFSKYLDLYINDLGYSSKDIGQLVAVTGLLTLVINWFVVPKMIKHVKATTTLISAVIISAVFSFLTFYLDQTHIYFYVYTFYLLYIVGKAIYEPTLTYHLSNFDEVSPGMIMGIRQSAISLGAVIGPLLGGYLYKDLGVGMFYILSFILVVSAGLLLYYTKLRGEYVD